jgi:transposase
VTHEKLSATPWRKTAVAGVTRIEIRETAAELETLIQQQSNPNLEELFLDPFGQAYPDSLNILQVDNGAFHRAKYLVALDNIVLLVQPPYCPELNPIEHLWQHLKKDLRWPLFQNLTPLQAKVDGLIADLTTETVASVTGFSFIVDALSVAGIF